MVDRESTAWLAYSLGRLKEIDRDRAMRLLEEAPGFLHEANVIRISIQPIGGFGQHETGPEVQMRQIVHTAGGIELLRWTLDRMVSDLLDAKSKALGGQERKGQT